MAQLNPEQQNGIKSVTERFAMAGKVLLVGLLTLVMNLPMSHIQSLIEERGARQLEAKREVENTWSGPQVIGAAAVTVPYITCLEVDANTKTCKRRAVAHAHFLPSKLDIRGALAPEVRYRGIFKVLLYQADVTIRGEFDHAQLDGLSREDPAILWDKARISISVADLKGIQQSSRLVWNDQVLPLEVATENTGLSASRIEAPLTDLRGAPPRSTFSLKLKLLGSEGLQFLPLGKQTQVHLQSPWGHPSFSGNVLPVSRKVSEAGFSAQWHVYHWGRPFPQRWHNDQVPAATLERAAFGVQLLFPVDTYQQTTRAAKYALLYILLTFVGFFLVEILQRRQVHWIQYLMVGVAISLFFLLLLSLAEHVVFPIAYGIATACSVGLVTFYSRYIIKSWPRAFLIGAVLLGLYGFLYVLLLLQDYALLMGSLGVFLILAIMMIVTRKVDWYQMSSKVVTEIERTLST